MNLHPPPSSPDLAPSVVTCALCGLSPTVGRSVVTPRDRFPDHLAVADGPALHFRFSGEQQQGVAVTAKPGGAQVRLRFRPPFDLKRLARSAISQFHLVRPDKDEPAVGAESGLSVPATGRSLPGEQLSGLPHLLRFLTSRSRETGQQGKTPGPEKSSDPCHRAANLVAHLGVEVRSRGVALHLPEGSQGSRQAA